MRRTVFALLFVALAVGLAQDGPGAMGTMIPAARDPRVLALRAEQEAVKNDPALVKELENRIQEIYVESQPQPAQDGGGLVQGESWWEMPQSDGPDVLIDTGVVWATGADYEMTGEMYIAYSRGRDSTVRVVKSTDHGNSWQPLTSFFTTPKSIVRRLHLVVGAGDSAFVYVPVLHPDNNGDVTCARFNRGGGNLTGAWVSRDSWTINNFTFCRDYVNPYYLYCCAGNDNHTPMNDDHLLRSTTFGRTWAELNTFRFISDGSYQAGAGSYLYLAGHQGYSPLKGRLNLLVNNLYAAPDSWREQIPAPDTFTVEDPVMAPSFITPPSAAVIWRHQAVRRTGQHLDERLLHHGAWLRRRLPPVLRAVEPLHLVRHPAHQHQQRRRWPGNPAAAGLLARRARDRRGLRLCRRRDGESLLELALDQRRRRGEVAVGTG